MAIHSLLAQLDADGAADEALGLLRDLIRFDTSNPPGEELECARFVAEALSADGIDPQVLESAPGRGNVVARLAGGDDGPLLLNAHLDVVPAAADRWTHPPFAAELDGGYLWGRGAIDMKHMAAMAVTAMRLLARHGIRLRRDVVFAGVADEEAGCDLGSGWLVDEHPDRVCAEYALGEVGAFTLDIGGRRVYPVQVAEKGICWLRARATGPSGHGSIPREDNAVLRLATFLDRLGRTSLPQHPSESVTRFLREIAATQTGAARHVLPLLLQPLASPVVERLLPDPSTRRTFNAVLRNTATPTVLRAGAKTNVIPGVAEAELDGRIAVGSSAEELVAELRDLAGDAIELEVVRTHPPTESPVDTRLFGVLSAVVTEHDPGNERGHAVAVPSVIPGFTDASRWSTLGTTCYGFSPVVLDPQRDPPFAELFHADDERIPVDGFKAGFAMLLDVLLRWCADTD